MKKTRRGKSFGKTPSEDEVRDWLENRRYTHMGPYTPIIGDEVDPSTNYVLSQIGVFSISDVFEIFQAGEYTLHIQVSIIQVGKDPSGRNQFVRIPFPETIAKFEISSNEIKSLSK